MMPRVVYEFVFTKHSLFVDSTYNCTYCDAPFPGNYYTKFHLKCDFRGTMRTVRKWNFQVEKSAENYM